MPQREPLLKWQETKKPHRNTTESGQRKGKGQPKRRTKQFALRPKSKVKLVSRKADVDEVQLTNLVKKCQSKGEGRGCLEDSE